MTWLEAIAVLILFLGLGGGAFMVAQRPSFWIGLGKAAFTAALPAIVKVLSKRMTPEQEAALRDCHRRGGEWDHIRKKCKR